MLGGLEQGLRSFHPGLAQAVDVVDEHDAVVHHDTDEQHAPDDAEEVHLLAGDEMNPHRADRCERDGQHDREGHHHALEQERHEQVNENDGQPQGEKAVEDFLHVEPLSHFAERDALGQVDVALERLDGFAGFLFLAALEFQPDGVADALVGAADVAGAVEHGRPRECADGAEPAILGGNEEVIQVRQFGPVLLAVPDTNGDLPAVAVEAGKRAAAQGVTDHAGESGGVHADGTGAVAIDEQGQLVGGLVVALLEGDHAGDVSEERLELVGQRIELLRILA